MVMLNGETNSELMIDNISGDDQGGYTVVVSNCGGNVESKVASLVVLLPVDIVEDVKDLTVREGAIARFEVEVTGTSPFNYQWFYGGIPIEDAIDPIYEMELRVMMTGVFILLKFKMNSVVYVVERLN